MNFQKISIFTISIFYGLTLCCGQTNVNYLAFKNCGSSGDVTYIKVSGCQASPCTFSAGDELTLEYEYVTEQNFPKLDFYLCLIEKGTGIEFPVRFTPGSVQVVAHVPQESYIRILLNDTIPPGKSWDMQIVRTFNEKEVCANLLVEIDPTLETTTIKTTPPPQEEFQCPSVGFFPDPSDCSVFHECQLYLNGTLWDTVMTCPDFTVWCQEQLTCQFDHICHCQLNYYSLY